MTAVRPKPFATRPIDGAARDGRYQLVFDPRATFAVARWVDGRWLCSSGRPIDFEPTEYR